MKRVIRDIEKNSREIVRVELDEYQGKQLVSARVWFRDGDTVKPSSKGLSIDVKHLPALRQAIDDAEAAAHAAGLLANSKA
jgi:hypothetical protein